MVVVGMLDIQAGSNPWGVVGWLVWSPPPSAWDEVRGTDKKCA
jgi:hypothetical protein